MLLLFVKVFIWHVCIFICIQVCMYYETLLYNMHWHNVLSLTYSLDYKFINGYAARMQLPSPSHPNNTYAVNIYLGSRPHVCLFARSAIHVGETLVFDKNNATLQVHILYNLVIVLDHNNDYRQHIRCISCIHPLKIVLNQSCLPMYFVIITQRPAWIVVLLQVYIVDNIMNVDLTIYIVMFRASTSRNVMTSPLERILRKVLYVPVVWDVPFIFISVSCNFSVNSMQLQLNVSIILL